MTAPSAGPDEPVSTPEGHVVVAGESLVDLLVATDGRVEARLGGGPFNVARTIARLGVSCAYLGRLSADRFGARLAAALAADGVERLCIQPSPAPTSLAVAEVSDTGTATYQFYLSGTAAADLVTADVRPQALEGCAALHVGTLGLVLEPMAETLAQLTVDQPQDTLVMVDPNCRAAAIPDERAYRQRLHRVLGRADVVRASTDDLDYLFPSMSAERAGHQLLEMGPSVVLVTDGPAPMIILTAAGESVMEVPSVAVVDSVGAGDAFGGGFLAWWIGNGLGRSHLAELGVAAAGARAAATVAAVTCQRAGADPPRRSELAPRWLQGADSVRARPAPG